MDSRNSNQRLNLLDQAKSQVTNPGVYLMKEESGLILYVGKAKNLKNRLTSYFQTSPHQIPRTELLVGRIHHFDVILTETEAEALILEATLIKKHKPKYNVRLKDDKSYPYIKIDLEKPFARLEWTRKVRRDGARYFGPFPSGLAARQVLELLTQTFKLRDCSDNSFKHRSRPCILYQMGQCSAPCVGHISQEDYLATLREAARVLEGKSESFVNDLKVKMQEASENLEYEFAAELRDELRALELVTATQGADQAGSHRSRDVVMVVEREGIAHAVILVVRDGKLISVKHFQILVEAASSEVGISALRDVVLQHYSEALKLVESEEDGVVTSKSYPSELLVEYMPDDAKELEQVLKLKLSLAQDEVDRRLLEVARTNASYGLDQQIEKTKGHGVQALEEVMKKLHLDRFPRRIECYDISNTQGEESVASRVVFINGAPSKDLYRRYKIKTVTGSNDFAMMKEVLSRRFVPKSENNAESLPDLVMVDGGKGQLSQAVAIFNELGIVDVALCGLAKARTESDFKSSVVKASSERIFLPNRKNPVMLFPHTDSFKLLTHLRDEAHRFAITYHRSLRSKKSLRSDDA